VVHGSRREHCSECQIHQQILASNAHTLEGGCGGVKEGCAHERSRKQNLGREHDEDTTLPRPRLTVRGWRQTLECWEGWG
jgi:hypothetical protein